MRYELQKHGVELRTELDESLPALEGDRVQLQQVVLNLVINAIEAMQSVAPRILSIRSCVNKPNFVHVAVEDTGTGIDPSDHDHIFNPMFTTKERGMGIGLSICHSIIESHNGRIWVTRGIGKGSIFQFELPTNVGQGVACALVAQRTPAKSFEVRSRCRDILNVTPPPGRGP